VKVDLPPPPTDGAGKTLASRPAPTIVPKNIDPMQSLWLRLVTARVVTYRDCHEYLTIDDVCDLNEQMDMEAAFAGNVIWRNE